MLLNCTAAVQVSNSIQPLHKAFKSRLGPDAMSLAWPAVVQLVVFLNSGWQCCGSILLLVLAVRIYTLVHLLC